MLLLECSGEYLDAEKLFDLTGSMVALVLARLCPRASWCGCFFASVCSLDRGRLARS
jgi:hypothetical protein